MTRLRALPREEMTTERLDLTGPSQARFDDARRVCELLERSLGDEQRALFAGAATTAGRKRYVINCLGWSLHQFAGQPLKASRIATSGGEVVLIEAQPIQYRQRAKGSAYGRCLLQRRMMKHVGRPRLVLHP